MTSDPLSRMKRLAAVVTNPPDCTMPLTMIDCIIILSIWQSAQRGEEMQFSDLYANDPSEKNIFQGAVAKLSYGRQRAGGARSEGLDLIEHSIDATDRRRRLLTLSARGRAVAEALVEALAEPEAAPVKAKPAPKKPAVEPARDPSTGKVAAKRKKAA